jgi:hypothetical protein
MPRPARPKVKLRKEMVRSVGNGGVAWLPTWIITCNRCGDISRNWAYASARDVRAAHIRKHAERHSDWRGR